MSIRSIAILVFTVLVSATAASAADRCIHFPTFPTLTCAHGFHPKEVKSHCWSCVPNTHDGSIESLDADTQDAQASDGDAGEGSAAAQ